MTPNSSTEKTFAYNGINKNEINRSRQTANPKDIKLKINAFIFINILNVLSNYQSHT